MNQIVKWNGGRDFIIVRPGLVEDELVAGSIAGEISNAYPEGTWNLWRNFADLCSQTLSSSGLSFQPELVRNMDPAQKRNAYEEFLKIPKSLRTSWLTAYNLVNAASDYVLGPEPLPDSAPKK